MKCKIPYIQQAGYLKMIAVIGLCGIGTHVSGSVFTPVSVAGFNADVIVGSTSSSPYSDDASPVDPNGTRALYEFGLTGSTEGLPADGLINAPGGRSFQLKSDAENNALIMMKATGFGYTTTGTLTLTNPTALSKLSLLTSAGYTSAGITYTSTLTINYSGGATSQYNWNTYEAFSNPAYGNPTDEGLAINELGRVVLSNNTIENSGTYPNLYYMDIDLSSDPNLGTPITSILFDVSGSVLDSTDANANIYALSGIVVAVPEPSTTALIVLSCISTFVLIRRRKR